MSSGVSYSPDARRAQILRALRDKMELSVEELAETFGVSTMTIRRDVQELAHAGQVVRTHGGASLAQRVSFEFNFLERAGEHKRQKQQIAEVAATLVLPGESVMLDSGTTTLEIARRLKAIANLTVATTSLPIASELFGSPNTEVILLGGALRRGSPDLVGIMTETALELMHTDVAFIGADAIDTDGNIYNRSADLAHLLKRMPAAANRVYAAADASKIGRRQLVRFANLADWQGVITDDGLEPRLADALREHGFTLHQPLPDGAW